MRTFDLNPNWICALSLKCSRFFSLRVLCVSYNSIKSLGSFPCPKCYAHTAESRAQFQKNKSALSSISSTGFERRRKSFKDGKTMSMGTFRETDSPPYSPRGAPQKGSDPPKVFPRLEVLIMSHNSKGLLLL